MFQSSLDEVLHEIDDLDQEPGEDEIREYAELIGIDVDKESDLLWIARAGITAPLPADWKPIQVNDGDELYFYNFKTGESSWEHPSDDKYRQMVSEERKKKSLNAKATGNGGVNKAAPIKGSTKPESAPSTALKPLKSLSPAAVGKLAPIGSASAPVAPAAKLQPINQSADTAGAKVGQKTLAPISSNANQVERPRTSRGLVVDKQEPTELKPIEAKPAVVGGGSRFLKKAEDKNNDENQPKDIKPIGVQNVLRFPSEESESESSESFPADSLPISGADKKIQSAIDQRIVQDLDKSKPSISVPAVGPVVTASKPPVPPKTQVQSATPSTDSKPSQVKPQSPSVSLTTASPPEKSRPPSSIPAEPPVAKSTVDTSANLKKVEEQLQEDYERKVRQLREQHDSKLKDVRTKFEEEEKKETEKIKRNMEDRLKSLKEKQQKEEANATKSATLVTDHQKTLGDMKKKFEKEIVDEERYLDNEKKKKIDELRDKLQKELDEWYRKEKERKLALLKSDIEKELSDMKKEMETERRLALETEVTKDFERRRRELEDMHQRQLESIQREHKDEVEKLKLRNKELMEEQLGQREHEIEQLQNKTFDDFRRKQEDALKAAELQLTTFREELSALTRMTMGIRQTLQSSAEVENGVQQNESPVFDHSNLKKKYQKVKTDPKKRAVVKSIDELLSPEAGGDQSARTISSTEKKLNSLETDDVLAKVARFLASQKATGDQLDLSLQNPINGHAKDVGVQESRVLTHAGTSNNAYEAPNLQRIFGTTDQQHVTDSAIIPSQNLIRYQPKDEIDEFLDRKLKEYLKAPTISHGRHWSSAMPNSKFYGSDRLGYQPRVVNVESELNSLKRWLNDFENRISIRNNLIRLSTSHNNDRSTALPLDVFNGQRDNQSTFLKDDDVVEV